MFNKTFLDIFDSLMHSSRRFNSLDLSVLLNDHVNIDKLYVVLDKFGTEIKEAKVHIRKENVNTLKNVLQRLPNIQNLDVNPHYYYGSVGEVEAGKVDEQVVKLTKLKCLRLNSENPMVVDLFNQLIPEGALEELKVSWKISENCHESLKIFFAAQINIKSL
jgi:hypothetical protein